MKSRRILSSRNPAKATLAQRYRYLLQYDDLWENDVCVRGFKTIREEKRALAMQKLREAGLINRGAYGFDIAICPNDAGQRGISKFLVEFKALTG